MRRICFLVLLPIAVCSRVSAQDSIVPKVEKHLWVQYNPFALFEPDVPIGATVLYQPVDAFGVSLDMAVYVAYRENPAAATMPMSGFRFRPSVKYYFNSKSLSASRFYLGAQGLIKQTAKQKSDWFTVNDSTGQPIFNQLKSFTQRKFVYGLNLLAGWEFIIGEKQKRWMLDLYGGLGLRSKSLNNIGLTDSESREVNSWGSYFSDTEGVFPSLSLGVTVGYRIF